MKKHIRMILLMITILTSLLAIAKIGDSTQSSYLILGTLCLVLYELLRDRDSEI